MRINAPNSIAPFVFANVMGPLLARNPHLAIEIVATDRLVDIVAEGFDAGIRLGASLQNGMTAVRIRPRMRFVVVGSPDYFKRHGKPRTPDDLARHACIQNMYPSGARYPWSFVRDGKQMDVHPTGPLALDDHELMIQAAIAGAALAYVWEKRAEPAVKDGRLVRCLDSWIEPEDWLHLYYPTRKFISAGLRAVIEAMRA